MAFEIHTLQEDSSLAMDTRERKGMLETDPSVGVISDSSTIVVPVHPLGIKPLGNAFAAEKNIKAAAGYFSALPEELLIQLLEYLEATSLSQLGRTCKVLYAFSRFEDLWKVQCIE